jgi:hypothetical protein
MYDTMKMTAPALQITCATAAPAMPSLGSPNQPARSTSQ